MALDKTRSRVFITNMKAVIRDDAPFQWMDLLNPTTGEMDSMARAHDIPATAVQDCLDARHLPKYEPLERMHFMILRAYDAEAPATGDTVQELTRKLALFFSDDRLITVHRTAQPYLDQCFLREKESPSSSVAMAVLRLISRAFDTYTAPIETSLNELDELEESLFESESGGMRRFEVRKAYLLKRRASVIRRMLRHSSEVLGSLDDFLSSSPGALQDLREKAHRLRFFADELEEGVTTLLHLHLSLSSQKTNEVMRVLTVFSAFILPLSIVTGIYGMNFRSMPELDHPLGYPAALAVMLAIEITIYLSFRKKGWLK
jgi:magnesium transporter